MLQPKPYPPLYSFYLSEGFIHLESIVGEAIIRLMANPGMTNCSGELQHNISVSMRQLPYPEYTVDIYLTILTGILPLFVVLAYIYSAGVFTKVYTSTMYMYMYMYIITCIYVSGVYPASQPTL